MAREREESKKAEIRKANAEANNLFDAALTAAPAYQPKAKVTKKIRLLKPDGYLQVLMQWWLREGSKLPQEDLDKIFKKQITFCEKLANKDGEFIRHESVTYVDEVKAQ